jgi:hypothetical protein
VSDITIARRDGTARQHDEIARFASRQAGRARVWGTLARFRRRRRVMAAPAIGTRHGVIAVPPGYVLVYAGEWGTEELVVLEGTAVAIIDGRVHDTICAGAVVSATSPLARRVPEATIVASSPMRFLVLE